MNKVPFQTFIFGALVADHLRPWCIFLGMLEAQKSSQHPTVTLWLFNIAMENGPFIDGLPGFTYYYTIYHWIGLRKNLNRKPWFLPSN